MKRRLLVAAICLAAILFVDNWIHGALAAHVAQRFHIHGPTEMHAFWDARPYAEGIDSLMQGRSPYSVEDLQNLLPFAYPPVFAWVGAGFARLLTPDLGWKIYVVVNVICADALAILLAAFFLRDMRRRQIVALLCFAPLIAFMTTVFWSGNIHVVWYFAALCAALPGLRRNQWLWYYVVAFLAMVNQPIFALLLLLPLFTSWGQYLGSAITCVAAGCAYLLEMLLAPNLYHQFKASAVAHLAASRDFGGGVFGILAYVFARLHHFGTVVPGAIQVLFSAAVLGCLLWLRPRVDPGDRRWLALIVLAMVLMNPRIMTYDAVIALVPACFFLIFTVRSWWQWPLLIAIVGLTCLNHRILGDTLVVFAGFVAGVRELKDRPEDALGADELMPFRGSTNSIHLGARQEN